MVYDKDILDTTVEDMRARLLVVDTKRAELFQLLNSMESIHDETFFTTDPDGAPVRQTRIKKDPDTRADFTQTRKDTVFDMNVPLAQTRMSETI